MNITLNVKKILEDRGITQVWLTKQMNKYRFVLGKEKPYSENLINYKLNKGSFDVSEFLILLCILDIDLEEYIDQLKKNMEEQDKK